MQQSGDLPDRDLEAYARDHGALPFEAFFGEVERLAGVS